MNETGPRLRTFEPSEVRSMFDVICYGYNRGTVTLDDFNSALGCLRLNDPSGRIWTIGSASGKWYRWVGGEWVEDEPRGPLTFALQNNDSRSPNLEPHAQSTPRSERTARRSRELKEDRLAEEERLRKGLNPDQELEDIKRTRPIFIEEYDKRVHQGLLRLWKAKEEQRKRRRGGRDLPHSDSHTSPPPKQPWIYNLDRYLNELTPTQLRLYDNWRWRIESYWRRYPEKWK